MILLGWNCDFCGKPALTVSLAGIVYCSACRQSYGQTITTSEMDEKFRKLFEQLKLTRTEVRML